ncbi:hypothetical protein VSH64_40205 [Amycolatopsis rhabdoformis]|uniref:Uncharacterized protein n=1 Tax=Amycolatopsis rhabdoformis TaxID=1448059 RepID=A0ABZ1I681_9PSEU|nr:hypothetical protein [Amycolatopsis rhabdoformis]WSE28984.1 hypothetical protein VSH64_40205 [Amycolatopsis rhabdoformis]
MLDRAEGRGFERPVGGFAQLMFADAQPMVRFSHPLMLVAQPVFGSHR